MKWINYITIFLALVVLLGCSKRFRDLEDATTLYGDSYIRGRVFITDTVTQLIVGKPQKGAVIRIRAQENAGMQDYLFEVKADDNGYFIFRGLNPNKTFEIQCDTIINGANFSDSTFLKPTFDSGRLNLSFQPLKQSGVVFTAMDASGVGRIKGATFCLFNAPAFFNSNTCDGNSYSIITNEIGKATVFNIPTGTYYVLGNFATSNPALRIKDTVIVTSTTLIKTYRLQPVGVAPTLNYKVLDSLGSSITAANVCLFSSSVLYARDTCEGANFTLPTNSAGNVSFSSLPNGRYFVLASFYLNGGKIGYIARDTVDFSSVTLNRELRLKRKY
jgi:hypothetical protein